MGLPRSTFYDAPAKKTDDAEIVISAQCSSRITTPVRQSNPQPDTVHPQGRTPDPGSAFRAD
jgi:hypothetical protein